MAFNRDDYVKIKESYDLRRRKAAETADIRKTEICAIIPQMKEICDKLEATGPRIFAAVREGKDGLNEKLAAIRAENEALIEKESALLTSNGYPADWLDIKYECPLCRDEGNIDGRMCSCMRQKLIKAGYESSGISHLCEKMNFDTFSLSYYTGDDRKNMETVYKKVKDYADNFNGEGSGSVLLFGGTGLGKTHLAVAIAKRVVERGFYTVYVTSGTLFNDFRDERFRREGDAESKTAKYSECELLVIDDLGTELPGRDVVAFLYNLMNTRINSGRSTVISTNLSTRDMLERYDDRIVSRIYGEFLTFRFSGKDVRMQKLKEN